MTQQALYTVEQMRTLERKALAAMDISGAELMRRAARAAFNSLRRRWPEATDICVCCGPGNNGGDGFLLAVLAREAGLRVAVVALSADAHGDAASARREWQHGAGQVTLWDQQAILPVAEVYVDALFGIGLNRAPEGISARLIEHLNAIQASVLSLDVPSGLNADTGDCPGFAVRADATVTFIAGKRGLHSGRAANHTGIIERAALGVPDKVFAAVGPDARLLPSKALPSRRLYANKGNYGHVLVIGGDHGASGAVRLAGEAALRAGAGLVSVATRADNVVAVGATRPELMVHAVSKPEALDALLERASVLALGPGLGQKAWGRALWQRLVQTDKPLVLDADGLNLLSKDPRRFNMPVVMTPHPGEAGRLLDVTTAEIEHDRFAAVREIANRYHAVVVLKGSGSLICGADGRLDVCPWGNPGMASGGMGDLLTGIIAALLAQGCDAGEAARLGVGLHARAADCAARDGERGLLASDLLAPLRRLGNDLACLDDE